MLVLDCCENVEQGRVIDRDEGGDKGRCSTMESFVGECNKFKSYSEVNGQPLQ